MNTSSYRYHVQCAICGTLPGSFAYCDDAKARAKVHHQTTEHKTTVIALAAKGETK